VSEDQDFLALEHYDDIANVTPATSVKAIVRKAA
jgi:hypothetical protein